jgi:hypothetical protein
MGSFGIFWGLREVPRGLKLQILMRAKIAQALEALRHPKAACPKSFSSMASHRG